MTRLIIIASLLFLFVCINVFAQSLVQSEDYLIGKSNGEQAANGSVVWAVAGFGCGCFGIGFAYLNKPNPNPLMLAGKSDVYIAGYIQGYQNKARNANIVYASIGWLASIVLLSVLSSSSGSVY